MLRVRSQHSLDSKCPKHLLEYCYTHSPRNIFFVSFNILTLIVYYAPLRELLASPLLSEIYSHIILIPFISGYIIFLRRKTILGDVKYALPPGFILMGIGATLYLIGTNQGPRLSQDEYLALVTFSAVIFWIGGFIFCYGIQAFRNAAFPLLFLVFTIPLPSLATEKIIHLLQSASAEVSYLFFKMMRVPVFREGFVFHLPGVSIEVAELCSGIRSSLALLISTVLTGHLVLRTGWGKVLLMLSIFPIAVLKNGVRIVTLSLLGAYVDERFLTQGLLHSRGGILFFLLALAIMALVAWLLKQVEE